MDLHKQLVKSLIIAFQNRGYRITHAVVDEYPDPYKIGNHEPDIIAKDNNGLIIIGEAKTNDDISNQRSKEQFFDFSNRIMAEGLLRGTKIPLHIIIPRGSSGSLRQILASLGIDSKIGDNIFIWVK